jgi:DNA invertase Pin-like site-specific DNA recombinase
VGWPDPLVAVIADELGPSGRSAQSRHGLQRLVADVALGQVGIVMGRAIARLARNHADCQPWLQLCGLHQTLLYDAEAVYAWTHLTDRLVLGLKKTSTYSTDFTSGEFNPPFPACPSLYWG